MKNEKLAIKKEIIVTEDGWRFGANSEFYGYKRYDTLISLDGTSLVICGDDLKKFSQELNDLLSSYRI